MAELPKLITDDTSHQFLHRVADLIKTQQQKGHKPLWVFHTVKHEWLLTEREVQYLGAVLNFKFGWSYHGWQNLREVYQKSYGLVWSEELRSWSPAGDMADWGTDQFDQLQHLKLHQLAEALVYRATSEKRMAKMQSLTDDWYGNPSVRSYLEELFATE